MKKHFAALLLMAAITVQAQVFEVESIQYKGDPDKFINIVIMGDGYTESQQDDFMSKAQSLANYLFTQPPWGNYKNFFNIYAIKVISSESGVKHPNTASDCGSASVPVANPNNYFGSRFDYNGIHRLVVPTNNTRIASVLANNFPNYDQVLIIANSPYYGGSGGSWATTTAMISAYDTTAHEMAHSFAGLADEYFAGDAYLSEKPNMTAQSDPALVKWKNWINSTNIDMYHYCCGGNSNLWYKPSYHTCKMEALNLPYCSVCNERIIEKIHSLINPIVSYAPVESTINSTEPLLHFTITDLMRPIPNTLNTKWQLDDAVTTDYRESFAVDQNTLTEGMHTLSVVITDATDFVRTDNHQLVHTNSITWTINRTALGVDTSVSSSKVAYAIFPNPSSDLVTVSINLEKKSSVAIDIVSTDGKIIEAISAKKTDSGRSEKTLSLAHLASGNYLIILKIDGVRYTKTVVKQ